MYFHVLVSNCLILAYLCEDVLKYFNNFNLTNYCMVFRNVLKKSLLKVKKPLNFLYSIHNQLKEKKIGRLLYLEKFIKLKINKFHVYKTTFMFLLFYVLLNNLWCYVYLTNYLRFTYKFLFYSFPCSFLKKYI